MPEFNFIIIFVIVTFNFCKVEDRTAKKCRTFQAMFTLVLCAWNIRFIVTFGDINWRYFRPLSWDLVFISCVFREVANFELIKDVIRYLGEASLICLLSLLWSLLAAIVKWWKLIREASLQCWRACLWFCGWSTFKIAQVTVLGYLRLAYIGCIKDISCISSDVSAWAAAPHGAPRCAQVLGSGLARLGRCCCRCV